MKRRYSLKRNKEFRFVYRTGKSVPCRSLVIVYRKNNTGLLRVGFSVSKKIGNSVTRNRVKRRLRSALDFKLADIDPNYNLIFIARHSIVDLSFDELKDAVFYLLKKSGVLADKRGNKENK